MISYYISCDCLSVGDGSAILEIRYCDKSNTVFKYQIEQEFHHVDNLINLGESRLTEGERPNDSSGEREQVLGSLYDAIEYA